MEQQMPQQQKRIKHRSPSYPAFDLETAIQRAIQLQKIAGRHEAPLSAALQAWGFSPKSSNGSLTLAALKKYGLAEDAGKLQSRTIALTRLGRELVFYDSDHGSEEWLNRAQTAALQPAIHDHLWKKYNGDLPTDAAILPYLVFELNFSDSAAVEVLRQFRETIAFAQLKGTDAGDTVSAREPENPSEEAIMSPPEIELHPAKSESRTFLAPETELPSVGAATRIPDVQMPKMRTVQLPYSRTGWALLQAEFPMSGASWEQMLAVLNAMKPSLVESDED